MTLLWIVLAIAIVGGTVAVALGRGEAMAPVHRDQPAPAMPPDDRPLHAEDLAVTRLSIGLRGYRMDEVDGLLDRLQRELAERDQRLAVLDPVYAGGRAAPAGSPPAPAAAAAPTPSTAPAAPRPVGPLDELGDTSPTDPTPADEPAQERSQDRPGERDAGR